MGFRTAPSGPQKPEVLSPFGGGGAEGDTEKRQAEAGGGSDEFRIPTFRSLVGSVRVGLHVKGRESFI